MGVSCVCEKPKVSNDSIFILEETNLVFKRKDVCNVFMRCYSVRFKEIKCKEPDFPAEHTPANSNSKRNELNATYNSFNKNQNQNQNQQFKNSLKDEWDISSIRVNQSPINSYERFGLKTDDNIYFSIEIIKQVNKARINYTDYSKKIDKLAKNVKFDIENSQFTLDFKCNNKDCTIRLSEGVSSFKESSDFIRNLTDKLEEFEVIGDLYFPIKESIEEIDPIIIERNCNILLEKARGKWEIIAIHFLDIDFFDDAEMFTLISIVDGPENTEIRKNIFSKEITHLNINTKRINENKRVIYYIFCKKLF